jgi:predicted glycogen debranching enzyme
MDVDYQGILPTPRHGKPVEINAYWYSALRVADALAARLVRDGQDYAELAERVRESFLTKFWLEDRGCLADLAIEPGDENPEAARQVRCNQIWALTQPFGMLSDAQARAVVDRVFELLWTPVGLRSLEPGDGQFHATYSGPQSERDMAYHQGTSWGFPLGAYYVAYLRVNGHSEQARADVRRQLAGIEATLIEGCVGQIAEVFDGGRPTISKGCFAQAWSVTEMLRAYAALEGR